MHLVWSSVNRNIIMIQSFYLGVILLAIRSGNNWHLHILVKIFFQNTLTIFQNVQCPHTGEVYQTPSNTQTAARGRESLRVFWPKACDLMQANLRRARRALGVHGSEAPSLTKYPHHFQILIWKWSTSRIPEGCLASQGIGCHLWSPNLQKLNEKMQEIDNSKIL